MSLLPPTPARGLPPDRQASLLAEPARAPGGPHRAGELVGFLHQSADGSFAIARLRDPEGEKIAVGPIGHVAVGQSVRLTGRWTEHSRYGRRFQVERVVVEDPRTVAGIERYLISAAIPGLGDAFARRVVEHFGVETLRIIDEDPERLREVPGIGSKRLTEIKEHWARDRRNREVQATLRGFGLSQALANKVIDRYGAATLGVVQHTPYRLCAEINGVGFRTADAIARAVGLDKDDPARAEAGAAFLLDQAEGEGHCFLPLGELLRRAERLEISAQAMQEAVERAEQAGTLRRHEAPDPGLAPIYGPLLDQAEEHVAAWLVAVAGAAGPGRPVDVAEDEAALNLQLNGQQREAVEVALRGGLTLITGGPGTGKTTIVRVLVRAARRRGEVWLLAAPTGRAARRLAEATGAEARTLHRLLEFNPGEGVFGRDHSHPLEADGVLIDEASMVDLQLMASLVDALPSGCRLVLVGDADQLPSVGPGRVLGELVECGAVPVCTLTEVYRQAADSGIVRNAWRIHRGEAPISAERDESGLVNDFFVLPRDRDEAAAEALVKVITERLPRLGFDPLRDVQVLTPMHAGVLGTEALNARLQAALNPDGDALRRGQRQLRVGDRVIQVRNDYDNEIFNGDTGRVVQIEGGTLHVDFDGRRVALSSEQLDDLALAWAISIHKSQGSEYPAVLVVLSRAHRVMLRRNLLYTAITRARRFCCVIGDPWAIRTAAQEQGGTERWSRLGERVRRWAQP
jgi:exodeoxyribonuclease V alpha subunit